MDNETLLREGPILKLIANLTIPSIVIMLIFILYNMADIFFIGQTGDPYQVAAITLVAPFYAIVQAVGTLLGTGGMIGISTALGRKDFKKAKAITAFVFYSSIILGIILSAVVMLIPDHIVKILGAGQETHEYSRSYLLVLAAGFPFMAATNVLANSIRADGSARTSMLGGVLGTVLNIILDPILILVFSMGVSGAALATVIGNIFSFSYLIIQVLKKRDFLSLSPKDLNLRKELTLDIVILGLPTAAGTVLMSFSSIFRNTMLSGYGELVIAGSGVSGRIAMVIGMVIMGITMGIQPAISYNYGAENYKRLQKILNSTLLITIAVGSLFTVIIILLKGSIIQLFIDNSAVISYGRTFIVGSLLTGPVIGIYQLSSSFLQATGKVSYAMLVTLLRQGIILIPVLWIMNRYWGLTGIVYSMATADVLSIVIAVSLSQHWLSTIKKRIK